MTSAQEQTVARYHELMQVNAAAHLLRTARQIGLLDQLRRRQHTIEELCTELRLERDPTRLLLDACVAIGVVEQYGADFALSHAAQLLCQYDEDFGDATWNGLAESLSSDHRSTASPKSFFDHQAATQWVHTAAAIQAAEVLNVGGDDCQGGKIMDLGCGSAVWSCAMGHRDPAATVTLVDHAGAIASAKSTATSIGMSERIELIEGDFLSVEIPSGVFDLVLIPQRVSGLDDAETVSLIVRAVSATKPGGRVAIIDLFRGPAPKDSNAGELRNSAAYAKPSLAESIEALKTHLGTSGGRIRTLQQAQDLLAQTGLRQVQFAYLSASRLNLGIAVGVKPAR